ncbi:MAG: hypothetical protein KatS3mg104_0398 [Phycisphaerae bacterium]|jgi:molybdopterin converting factor small subunit|nr:MAG: hypothetical protein KatS3mg104_0398 [Phycisphaerae bacterium]
MTEDNIPPYVFRVLLFGPIAQTAGTTCAEVMIEQPDILVEQLIETLCRQNPGIASSVRTCRIARNHAFAQDHERVSFRDELALIGMVSGG